MKKQRFTDGMDVNPITSLYEYGYLRSPDTGKTLVCANPSSEEHTQDNPPIIRVVYLDKSDIEERLQDIGSGFFQFIGSDIRTELDNLDNNHLAYLIHSIEMWDGSLETRY